MRIVSLNAWCGTMFDALAPWIAEIDADVLCLQEVPRTHGRTGAVRYEDAERTLDQRADLFADVAALLPAHQGTFVASDAGPVTDPDGRSQRQEFGLACFVRADIPIIGQRSAFVHGAFLDHETWPASGRPRIAQGVRLWDRREQRAISVVHLHGLRMSGGKGDTPERIDQADRIVELLDELRRPDDLAVVAGDLNLLPGSATFDRFRAAGLVELVGTADTRTSRYVKPQRSANYLAVSDDTAVRSFEIVAEPEVSDHRPLVLEVGSAPSRSTTFGE